MHSKWKDKKNRKPLLITGVRQCGKTLLIREFGQSDFEETAYFNLDGNVGIQSIFEYDFDVDRILSELGSIVYGKKIVPGKTLVVLDEIQDCPRVIRSLKYFCENMPELHIIAAGSLLDAALRKQGISFPVGKVDRLEMYPMSFEEFVMADDFGKYTSPDTATKIRLIWDAIPSQIARDNNKFIFSHVKQGARSKDLEDALEWIVNAGIAYKLNLVPIEVKSADNTKAKSLHAFCRKYQPKMALKTSLKNVGDHMDGDTHVWSVPLYAIFRIKEYLFHEMKWE
ncbi:MAG: AAA family ATPase [Oscillospiraceae bacterium]|nr:AAA family ATPase [Oscillospiraceae bacterium]